MTGYIPVLKRKKRRARALLMYGGPAATMKYRSIVSCILEEKNPVQNKEERKQEKANQK